MLSNKEIVDELMERLTRRISEDLKTSITEAVEQQLSQNFSRMIVEGEFYRRINEEMQAGLKDIYKEINVVRRKDGSVSTFASHEETGELLAEASDQLDEILRTTEQATEEIMEVVEKHLDLHATAQQTIDDLPEEDLDQEYRKKFLAINDEMTQDLMKIMTTLSFQDLTGQRIKRIIEALKKIEEITFNLYLTTGLKIKAKQENPDKDIAELETETREKVSELKGPSRDATSQSEVDDLLSQLGLE
jgi:chemotaxis protein CheZ